MGAADRARVAAVAAVVVSVVGCGNDNDSGTTTARERLAPPRIHERFTPLPCPARPVTTLELEGCAERSVSRTDAEIDASVRRIFARLGARGRRALVRAERSWVRYRNASCRAEASRYAGGSIETVVIATCFAERNRRHLADLSDLERAQRPS